MKFLRLVAMAGMGLALSAAAWAADIARLEWGSFVVEADSSNGWSEYKSLSSDDGRSLRMTFAPLEAKADGSTIEANARLAGHYDVIQPDYDSFSNFVAAVDGHIIKSSGSSARIVLKIGASEETIEWMPGQQASETFTRTFDIVLPAGGRLPSPFPVSIEAYVKKDGSSDAAYVSLGSLTISAVPAKVASN